MLWPALARLALADPWVAPTVSVEGLTTVGPLDRDQAWQGLVAVEREIVRCFHGSEPPVPSSVLTVRLGWTVSAEGLADSMTVLDTAAAPGLDACLVDALTEARFPNAPTPTTMEARLALTPTSPEASRLHRGPAVVLSGGTGPIPPNAGVLVALSDPPMTGLGGLLGSSGRSRAPRAQQPVRRQVGRGGEEGVPVMPVALQLRDLPAATWNSLAAAGPGVPLAGFALVVR